MGGKGILLLRILELGASGLGGSLASRKIGPLKFFGGSFQGLGVFKHRVLLVASVVGGCSSKSVRCRGRTGRG